MKISMSKTKITSICLLLLATIALPMLAISPASAHQPPWTINSYSYVTVSPNPLGPNQQAVIVFWQAQPPPSAAAKTGDRWEGMTLDITKPDGSVDHLGPFTSDPVGSGYALYTPQTVGTYTVKYNFPQQVADLAGTTGIPGGQSQFINDTFTASSATTTFVVQPTAIQYFQEAPLPGSYWTRPIDSNNQNWWPIGGSWLGQNEYGATYWKYSYYGGRAPATGHIMWTMPISFGGIVGRTPAARDDISYYSGTAYQLKFANPIIMYGNVYFALPLANNPTGQGVTCVDLRTGVTHWTRTDLTSVNFGQLLDFESPNQHGVNPNGYLWIAGGGFGGGASVPAGSRVSQPSNAAVSQLSGNYLPGTSVAATGSGGSTTITASASAWMAIDPMTGANVFNETNVPNGIRAQGPLGEWLQYAIGRPNNNAPMTYLWQWNNTKYPGQDSPSAITAWGAVNANYNMSAAYDWNVTLSEPIPNRQGTIGSIGGFGGSGSQDPVTGVYTFYPQIVRIFPGNLVFGQSSGLQLLGSTSSGVFGTPDKYWLWAINLNPSRGAIGKVLFQKEYNAPPGNLTAMIGAADGETNVFTMYYRETRQWTGYNMLTGEFLWGPTESEHPWNFYGGTTGLTSPYAIGYGNLYAGGYSGRVYGYDFKTGKLLFVYGNNASDPFNSTLTVNTVYGDYPEQIAAVADGKVYMVPCEHSLDSPPYHGASFRAIDAFTGKEQWKVYGMSSWQMQAVADGYWATLNLNDMQVYSFGPGPSSTTVEIRNDVIALGGSVEITGTVMDQSPALKGTPAIADADQGPWMQYMIQHNTVKPTAQGVPVKLTAKDPNGNIQDIGVVTSDSNGLFHKLWKPPVEGEYVVVAEFEGSQSYGGSSAAAAFGVTAAPSPVVTPTPTPTQTPATPTPPPTSPPTISPTGSPSPTETTAPPPGGIPAETIYAIAAAVIIIIVVAIAAVLLRRRK